MLLIGYAQGKQPPQYRGNSQEKRIISVRVCTSGKKREKTRGYYANSFKGSSVARIPLFMLPEGLGHAMRVIKIAFTQKLFIAHHTHQ